MADTKITALTPLAGVDVSPLDPLPIVDVSDLSMAASGTTKRLNAGDLSLYVKLAKIPSPGTSSFASGNIVRFNSSGVLAKSDPTQTGIAREVVGVAVESDSTVLTRVATMPGMPVEMLFSSAPSAGDEGKPVYLSASAPGTASLTAPTSVGQRVMKLGLLASSTVGPNGGYPVLFQPSHIIDL